MNGDPVGWLSTYRSRRSPVMARNVVATSQPLAAQAGLRMLQAGGNAIDAAVAAAAALTVVEPTMNGLGSDAFAIVWDGQQLHGLNASGCSPARWSPARFAGRSRMPDTGWDSVTVPGAVSAWALLSRRFGQLAFAQLLAPAIEYAEAGFPVSPVVALQWELQAPRLAGQPGFDAAFLPNGRPPRAGELFRHPAQARSLKLIAETAGDAFYRGELAHAVADACARAGGALSADDLSRHQADWVPTVAQPYRTAVVHELPPNGQGVAALMALGMLQCFDIAQFGVDTIDAVHLQVEAMKLAFADVYRYVSDPRSMPFDSQALLDADYLKVRAALIDPARAQQFGPGVPRPTGTVYLTTADASGRMVSMIQSNFMGFGSGVVVPGTGISLQNRGAGFSLAEGHPNQVAGGKRPFHTIIPGFLMRDGKPAMSFGVMGGDMQAQGHVQVISRACDFGQSVQAVADAPRWKLADDGALLIEEGFPPALLSALAERGHRIVSRPWGSLEFGAAQLVARLDNAYAAASEPRRDGQAVGC
mgnify:CR=1 FL=1